MKLDFSAILHEFYIFWWILGKNLSGVTLFKPFLLTKFLEKGKNLQSFKQFICKNSKTRFQNAETCFQKAETWFQKAETCFQNAKTALSRIFFAMTWMDKKSLIIAGSFGGAKNSLP